jgi:nucleoside phosphorylase
VKQPGSASKRLNPARRLVDVEDLVLNYDPESPQKRFLESGVEGAFLSAADRLPKAVPWPSASRPSAAPLDPAPSESDDLSRFHGYDAVVVTWTAAEAAALAALLTPEYLPSSWYEYRHNVDSYVPLVTGSRAPFNDRSADMARFYHSLGLYFPCRVGEARVLLLKCGLHLDYDGPATPVRQLIGEITQTVSPKLFITTGAGGGIGADVALGDVLIAGRVRFDCVTQFKGEPWRNNVYAPAPPAPSALKAISPNLTRVNAAHIEGARPIPRIWSAPEDTIVTTDFFGFDDSTDYYKLQGAGARICDMGDAMVADALAQFPAMKWFSIRNASDPQIPNPRHDIEAAKQQAGQIYARYGAFTTAASVIATWAVIDSECNDNQGRSTMVEKRKPSARKPTTRAMRHPSGADPLASLRPRVSSSYGGYGWTRDLPDARDYLYAAPLFRFPHGLPPSIDLRAECPPVYNQLQLGSCTANGIAGAIEFDQKKQGNVEYTPSRLFIYYNERVIEGTVSQDSGAQIRDGVKSVATLGAPPETDWPYDISKFAIKPPPKSYSDALQDIVTLYSRVSQNLAQMQGCLAEGYPFVFGFTVYQSFESATVAQTGIVPMPAQGEQVLGGHCVVAVGYDDKQRRFIVRNSWGTTWGLSGYCLMPYEYLMNASLASDFWTMRTVTG